MTGKPVFFYTKGTSYLFNFVEKKLNYFTESPFEKILLLVRIEVQKIVIQNIIPSFLARKK